MIENNDDKTKELIEKISSLRNKLKSQILNPVSNQLFSRLDSRLDKFGERLSKSRNQFSPKESQNQSPPKESPQKTNPSNDALKLLNELDSDVLEKLGLKKIDRSGYREYRV